MVQQYEASKDPNKTVTLLKATQWTCTCWEELVTAKSIQRCFWKSTVFKKPVNIDILDSDEQADRDVLQAQITELPMIEDPLSLNEFIDPLWEVIEDNNTDIFTSVVERYSIDDDDEVVEGPENDTFETELVSITEALKALEIVRLWELQQENGE